MTFPCRTLFFTITILLQINDCVSQRADFEVPENQLNRRFSWSTEKPIARAINDLAPDAIPFVDFIIRHTARVEKAVLESLKRERLEPQDIIQPCNPEISRKYRRSTMLAFGLRGFQEPAWNCSTDIRGVRLNHEDPGYTVDDLYEALFNHGAAIHRRVKDISARVINNASRPDTRFNFRYNTVSANCVLNIACMFRQGKHWHQAMGITTETKEAFLFDYARASIWEHLRVVRGKLEDPMLMRLPEYDDGNTERVVLENVTTYIGAWRGRLNPSCFRRVPIEENPAMVDALDLADHSSQLVEDSLSSSNLAILLLPIVLTMVPLSLFANVDTVTLLVYTILSDVLTVIPLAIKGVELFIIDQKRFRSVVTRIMSPALRNLTVPFTASGEVWGAECRVREGVRRTGIALMITSMLFLCIGVAVELAARNYMLSRKKVLPKWKWRYENHEPDILGSTPYLGERTISDSQLGTGSIESKYSSDSA